MGITLEELRLFTAVVENGSFSRAAESLGVATSVLSRSLKKLETKLGHSLLHRTTRSISATQEGVWLLAQGAKILSGAAEVEDYFLAGQRPRGLLRVDAPTPFTLHALVPLIAGFNTLYPEVAVDLQSSESISNLIARKVDVAIRIGELEDSNLKARKLGATCRGIYASPAYIERHGCPKNVAALQKHRCLGFTGATQLNSWPLLTVDKTPLTISPATVADSGETLRQLALQGNGIACLSAFVVREDVKAGRLMPLFKNKILPSPIPVYLVFHADSAVSSRVRCFIDYVAEFIDLEG